MWYKVCKIGSDFTVTSASEHYHFVYHFQSFLNQYILM